MLVEVINPIRFNDTLHNTGEIIEIPEAILDGHLQNKNVKIYINEKQIQELELVEEKSNVV